MRPSLPFEPDPALARIPRDAPLPWWKRTIDVACCVIALPFFAAIAAALWTLLLATSPGPLLFRQQRVGYTGRRFMLYKFRTMHRSADTAAHREHVAALLRSNAPMHKLDSAGDSRLVPGARLIRALGIDELPQLINVLMGEMSIVGPRPCIPYEYEQYSPWHRERLNAMPGLTGLWQVSGKNRTTFEEMVRLDIQYGQTKSPWSDLKIIARTVPALLAQAIDTHRRHRPGARVHQPSSARRPALSIPEFTSTRIAK
jgi:lipopolysaccharide/colanic/teichoic acid biosynthesis glycosyltransferase